MAFVAFIASVLVTGIISSFISVDTLNTRSDQPDYHMVPSAGDVFGA